MTVGKTPPNLPPINVSERRMQTRPRPPRPVVGAQMTVADDLMAGTEVGGENEGSFETEPRPPFGSRGHIQDEHERLDASGSLRTLSTIDRRPGRPAFHHLGPMPPPPPPMKGSKVPRRFRPHHHPQFERRVGGGGGGKNRLQGGGKLSIGGNKIPPAKTPIQQARELLGKVNAFVALARQETRVIAEVARNLTAEGREVNLWEIMTKVNSTVRQNPNSSLARLMHRFYHEYLVSSANEKHSNGVLNAQYEDAVYKKSLPSLLFLSFGIFLLNSVNEIISRRGVLATARMLDTGVSGELNIIDDLMEKHRELKEFFFHDDGSGGSTVNSTGKGYGNAFARLLLNLAEAYESSHADDGNQKVECIWNAYCHHLNAQAGVGGMASTVARITSVGMRAVLLEDLMAPSEAARSVVSNMWQWRNMDCDGMFHKCSSRVESVRKKEVSDIRVSDFKFSNSEVREESVHTER